MRCKLLFVGLVLSLIPFYSCQKKVSDAGIEAKPTNINHEVRDTLIDHRIIYFAGERKLNNHNIPDPGLPMRKIIYRNVSQLPMNESGVVKLYVEINAKGEITYLETLPESTINSGKTIKKIIKAVFGYRYEAKYSLPLQASILTISLEISKTAGSSRN